MLASPGPSGPFTQSDRRSPRGAAARAVDLEVFLGRAPGRCHDRASKSDARSSERLQTPDESDASGARDRAEATRSVASRVARRGSAERLRVGSGSLDGYQRSRPPPPPPPRPPPPPPPPKPPRPPPPPPPERCGLSSASRTLSARPS